MSEELENPEPEPVPERLIAMANGETVRVTRIDSVDIGFDRGALDESGRFVPTLLYQGVPPIEGYDPEVGVSDEALAAHIADKIANPPNLKTQARIYEEQLAINYTDSETGLVLKITEHAQLKFSQQFVLTAGLLAAGQITAETQVDIWDANNTQRFLTAGECQALLIRYGLHCKPIFREYAP